MTRAQLLKRFAGGGAGLALLGGGALGGVRLFSGDGAVANAGAAPVRHFHSRPELRPPIVTVLHPASGTAPGLVFMAPSSGPGQRGVLIMDDTGEPVWFRRTSPQVAMDFRPGVYRGKPVLSWWESLPGKGFSDGDHVIVDASYEEIARFPAGQGLPADLHELRLTPRGTALVTAIETRRHDLRSLGGSRRGLVWGGVAQELEIPSARVVWEWRSLDHVPVADSYAPIGYPWDYFHINSIDVDVDGDVLVSGRNTWGVYKVDRESGKVRWRLGGKRSDFALGRGARFAFQHDARHHGNGDVVTVFDNGAAERRVIEKHSRGLVIDLDFRAMRAELRRAYVHRPPLLGRQMGNVQLLDNGNAMIGWGTDPHLTEFGPDGSVRFDATLPHGGENYRAFRFPWTGAPKDRPALVRSADGSLYVSWNGATAVAAWSLETGRSPASLKPAGTVPRRGFETELHAPSSSRYAVAVALDAQGKPLGSSPPLRLEV